MEGFGAKFAVSLGRILSTIERDIILLYESFLQIEIINDSMLQNIDLLAGKDLIDEKEGGDKEERGIKKLNEEMRNINLNIENLNKKLLEPWKFGKKILTLDESKILIFYKERFDKKWSNQEALKLANEKFRLEVFSEISKVLNSIKEFSDQFENLEKFSGYENLKMPSKEDTREAIHINSIGYGRTAVLCVGRAIEGLIEKSLLKLFEKNKISKEDYDRKIDLPYSDKIGFLKVKFLTEEEFTDLKSFSFKRNKGGHSNLGDISNDEARTLIQQGILQITNLQKKIDEVKSEVEIEQEKAREMLGGETEAGQPMPYGTTPEEKLESIKGYGGKVADEMRKELLQEIKEKSHRLQRG